MPLQIPPADPPLETLTVRVRRADLDALDHLARRHGAPRSTVLRLLLQQALEEAAAA